VAIKVIDHYNGADAAAVAAEAQLLLSLDHPNVVKAYHLHQQAGIEADEPAREDHSAPLTSGQLRSWHVAGGSGGGADAASVQLLQLSPLAGGGGGAAAAAVVATAASSGSAGALASGSGSGSETTAAQQQHLLAVLPAAAAAQAPAASQPPSMTPSSLTASFKARPAPAGRPLLTAPRTMIVLEYCDGGDLSTVTEQLRAVTGGDSLEFECNLLALLGGAAAGLAFLHENRVVHSDVNVSAGLIFLGGGKGLLPLMLGLCCDTRRRWLLVWLPHGLKAKS
jgi:serine/threonine protein kinase